MHGIATYGRSRTSGYDNWRNPYTAPTSDSGGPYYFVEASPMTMRTGIGLLHLVVFFVS